MNFFSVLVLVSAIFLLQTLWMSFSWRVAAISPTTRFRYAVARLTYSAVGLSLFAMFWVGIESRDADDRWENSLWLVGAALALVGISQSQPILRFYTRLAGVPYLHRKLIKSLKKREYQIPEELHDSVRSYLQDCGITELGAETLKKGPGPLARLQEGDLRTSWAQVTSLYLSLCRTADGKKLVPHKAEEERVDELSSFYYQMTHRTARYFELIGRSQAHGFPLDESDAFDQPDSADRGNPVKVLRDGLKELEVYYTSDLRRLADGLLGLASTRALHTGRSAKVRFLYLSRLGFELDDPQPLRLREFRVAAPIFLLIVIAFAILQKATGTRDWLEALDLGIRIAFGNVLAVLLAIWPKARWAVATRFDERPMLGYGVSAFGGFGAWLAVHSVYYLLFPSPPGSGWWFFDTWPWAILPIAAAAACAFAADDWHEELPAAVTTGRRAVEAFGVALVLSAAAAVVTLVLWEQLVPRVIGFNAALGALLGWAVPHAWRVHQWKARGLLEK